MKKKLPPVKVKPFWISRDPEGDGGDYGHGNSGEINIHSGAKPPTLQKDLGRFSRQRREENVCVDGFKRMTGITIEPGEYAQARLHILKHFTRTVVEKLNEHREPA